MRITGGIYRGRRILCPKAEIRPAMDRMRVSLFAILGDLEGSSFLDLYSGSGIVGLEAASRGASPVVLVEKDWRKKGVLLKNISFVGSRIEVRIMPVERFILRSRERFDTIYLDPPFALKGKLETLSAIEARGLLETGGILVLHLPREESLPERLGRLYRADLRRYGRSVLLFYRLEK